MRRSWSWMGLFAAAVMAWAPASAQEEKKLGWTDTAEFSLVVTQGNSESQTVGLSNTLRRRWQKSRLEILTTLVRTETNDFIRFAVGTPGDFTVREVDDESTDPDRYYAEATYKHNIRPGLHWLASQSWERNRPSAVNNRYITSGGVGNVWFDKDDLSFQTAYSLTYTDEEDTTGETNGYAGLRFTWDYSNDWGQNTTYTNRLVVDENLDETEDFRVDLLQSVQVGINSRLALKVSVRLAYDNEPSFEDVSLFDPSDLTTAVGVVQAQKDELDTVFTTSLVAKFD